FGKVVVTGCYPQRYPQAAAKFPGVDEWNGVPSSWIEPKMPALRFTGRAFAYLKIAEGCAHRCAYCAIPLIRGRYRSRPVASVLREAKALVESGCREINIVAQDPMLYGVDLGMGRDALVKLLRKIDEIEGEFWVRVLYSYPNEITQAFIEWMVSSPHAVKYIDVPLQHTDPAVLALMNRRAAINASLGAAENLRAAIPGVTLRTTVMTGFPGETERRFATMRADLKRMQFDRLGAFAFSPEKGTKAAKMPSRPSRAVAEERERIIMADAARLWAVRSKRSIGGVFNALVVADGVARLASQAPDVDGVVYLLDTPEGRKAKTGDFVTVRIVAAKNFDFEAEVL
ncbi:MAG: radical SAM protein, partial [Kiritimatiellae bacterium]|nr:radical SAM protein [Kiritimatiellia bacterium]